MFDEKERYFILVMVQNKTITTSAVKKDSPTRFSYNLLLHNSETNSAEQIFTNWVIFP